MIILDENPTNSVRSLTSHHAVECYTELFDAFRKVYNLSSDVLFTKEDITNEFSFTWLLYNESTFLYYKEMYKNLLMELTSRKIINHESFIDVPSHVIPFILNSGDVFLGDVDISENVLIAGNPVIELNRYTYIKNKYKLSDFLVCPPQWYGDVTYLEDSTIFCKYDERLKKSFKITCDEYGYNYFISSDGCTWKEIHPVHSDIDLLIEAILIK